MRITEINFGPDDEEVGEHTLTITLRRFPNDPNPTPLVDWTDGLTLADIVLIQRAASDYLNTLEDEEE